MYPGVGTFVLILPAQTFYERIKVDIVAEGSGSFSNRVEVEGQAYNGMYLRLMPSGFLDIDTFLSMSYGSNGGLNVSRITDPTVEKLLFVQRQELDLDGRKAFILEMDRLLAEQAYVVPMHGVRRVQAYNRAVQRFSFHPNFDSLVKTRFEEVPAI